MAASGSLAVYLFLLIERVWPVNLPRRFDVDAEVVLSPLGRFSYDLDELRIESEQRKIVRIADDCFDVCSSHSTAALSKAHCIPQNIGHDVVEQPCGEVAANAQVITGVIIHQCANEPEQGLILADVSAEQIHRTLDGDGRICFLDIAFRHGDFAFQLDAENAFDFPFAEDLAASGDTAVLNREQFGAEQGHQRFNSDVLQDLLFRAFLADVTELLRKTVNTLEAANRLQAKVSLVDAGCEIVVVGGDGCVGFRPVIVLVQPLKSNLAFLYQASMNQFALEVVPFQLALECFNGSRKIECCGVDVHLRWFASRDRTLLPSFCISSGYYRWSSLSVPTSAGFKQFSHISEDAVVQ